MITTFKDLIKADFGIEMPEGDISMGWFEENKLPMLLECNNCGATMASPDTLIEKTDDHLCFLCHSCAE